MIRALGPGDDDPKSPARTGAVEMSGPLGPGDDDPRSPAKVYGEAVSRGPLGPGESDGDNPDDAFHVLTPGPAGPGGVDLGPRSIVRIPKRQSTKE